MKKIKYPDPTQWSSLCQRPSIDTMTLENKIKSIFLEVKIDKDAALYKMSEQFDGVKPDAIAFDLSSKTFEIDPELAAAIQTAKANIEMFHRPQETPVQKIETTEGVTCWRKSVAIQSVGLYIPGGSAPLFSTLLMLAIPAKIAGCKNIVVCTPPDNKGELNEVIGWTCKLLGIQKIHLIGGAQAIAAMTYGTPSVPKVDKPTPICENEFEIWNTNKTWK